ncbi:vanadium-dependent haloperoxidase [Microbulbifer rhizosphaerae]|uniref:PAP2 superfamily protein n=1 Tax=Microbulbifer rhizosphaerae TaxID=1562603 RepID=A0A7W4W9Q6_9GAMM|nr:vanadium-dependent haloperoxidase [Microbulbifer rhizosphaerae]MBB3060288.1 hypothetical protein [Microbulbifer rhizosphaerae]
MGKLFHKGVSKVLCCTMVIVIGCFTKSFASESETSYDFKNGNAVIEVAVPALLPVILSDVSSTAGDATLILRMSTLMSNAWFDASAPYHPTAVGVYSRLGRRPLSESETNTNINIAILYASYRVLSSLLPQRTPVWRKMLTDIGLDPDDDSVDLATPVGIGNAAGLGVVRGRARDGMNQLGDESERAFNPMPYMDYTNYRPINSAYRLFDPSRWQPDLQRKGMGLYKIQQFVTPQYALTEPYSYQAPQRFNMPPPYASNHWNYPAYKQQADEVLAASADLNDERKLKAELFDNKIESLGFSALSTAISRGLSLQETIELDFLISMAAHDAGIVIWQEKRRYDAVRPFSAIRYLYGDEWVSAWGGPGRGTIRLPANQWKSYLEEADHPEYPSASTCFCAAHAQAARRYLGTDVLNWEFSKAAGSSHVEPGITPAEDTILRFDTWTDFVSDCGQSRVWAGVHFQAAVDVSTQMCDVFGDMAHEYLSSLIDGSAPVRRPAKGKRYK